jgi:hypothetical protein
MVSALAAAVSTRESMRTRERTFFMQIAPLILIYPFSGPATALMYGPVETLDFGNHAGWTGEGA